MTSTSTGPRGPAGWINRSTPDRFARGPKSQFNPFGGERFWLGPGAAPFSSALHRHRAGLCQLAGPGGAGLKPFRVEVVRCPAGALRAGCHFGMPPEPRFEVGVWRGVSTAFAPTGRGSAAALLSPDSLWWPTAANRIGELWSGPWTPGRRAGLDAQDISRVAVDDSLPALRRGGCQKRLSTATISGTLPARSASPCPEGSCLQIDGAFSRRSACPTRPRYLQHLRRLRRGGAQLEPLKSHAWRSRRATVMWRETAGGSRQTLSAGTSSTPATTRAKPKPAKGDGPVL